MIVLSIALDGFYVTYQEQAQIRGILPLVDITSTNPSADTPQLLFLYRALLATAQIATHPTPLDHLFAAPKTVHFYG